MLTFILACTPDPVDSRSPEDTEAVSSSVIGLDGGRIALPDGTALLIPPGALEEELTLTLTEVEPLDNDWLDPDFYERVGPSYVVEPELFSVGDPFVFEAPEGHLLVASADGSEGLLQHQAWPLREGVFSFGVAGSAVYQAWTRTEEQARGPMPDDLPSLCSDAIARAGEPEVEGIDALVSLSWALGGELASHPDRPGHAMRMAARACTAAYVYNDWFTEGLGLPAVEGPVPLTMVWELRRADECLLGVANGHGLSMPLAGACDADAEGVVEGWNGPAGPDRMDKVVAHELFHYRQDHADGSLDGFGYFSDETGWDAMYTEGMADAAMEEAFDQADGTASPTPWTQDCLTDGYEANGFWRYADWYRSDPNSPPVLAQMLAWESAGGPGTITSTDFSDQIEAMTGRSFRELWADWVIDHIVTHTYEQALDGGPFDLRPDAYGELHDELSEGELWHTDAGVMTQPSVVGQPTDTIALDEGGSRDFELPPWGGKVVHQLDLSGVEGARRISITAQPEGTASRDAVTIKAYVQIDDRQTLYWEGRTHADGSPVSFALPPGRVDGLQRFFIGLASTVDEVVEVTVANVDTPLVPLGLSESGEEGIDALYDGLWSSPPCEGLSLDLGLAYRDDLTRVFTPVDGYAVSYPYTNELVFFSHETCDEVDRITLVEGANAGPAKLQLTDGQPWKLLVGLRDPSDACAAGAVVELDLSTMEELARASLPVGVTDLVSTGDDLGVAAPGEGSCSTQGIWWGELDSLTNLGTGDGEVARLDVTVDGRYLSWVGRGVQGDVAVWDSQTNLITILQSEDGWWSYVEDLAIVHRQEEGELDAVFLEWGYDGAEACEHGSCSSIHRVALQASSLTEEWRGEHPIPSQARALMVESEQRVWVAHDSSPTMTPVAMGSYFLPGEVVATSGELHAFWVP